MAHKLEAQGQRDAALKAYKGLLRRWPLSFFAPEAQYRAGKILEDEANFYDAFQAFQKMVTKYPSSDYFEQALDEQFRIANLYRAGEPQRIWKIPVGPSMDRTIEMYDRIIKNAPYGTYAPESQFDIGLCREQQRKYTDAVDAYQTVLDKYPTSSVAANAQYQIGYAWMKSCQLGDYDMGAAKKAVDAFQDYLVRYPPATRPSRPRIIFKGSARSRRRALSMSPSFTKPSTRPAPHLFTIMKSCARTPIPPKPKSPRSASRNCGRGGSDARWPWPRRHGQSLHTHAAESRQQRACSRSRARQLRARTG